MKELYTTNKVYVLNNPALNLPLTLLLLLMLREWTLLAVMFLIPPQIYID